MRKPLRHRLNALAITRTDQPRKVKRAHPPPRAKQSYLWVVNPSHETGMEDYRIDELDRPTHHPDAVYRLTVRDLRRRVDFRAAESSPAGRVIRDGEPPKPGKLAHPRANVAADCGAALLQQPT
jgi:hypothetical protein